MNQTSAITAAPGVILIADDSAEARRMLEVRVKREGHQPILVENGRQALDVLSRQKVDLLLLDIDMPELDGYAVLRTVKADPNLAHVPVLIISGGGAEEDLVRCIELGAVDFLPKPFNQALLRARVNACLLQKRQRDRERQETGTVGKNKEDTDETVSATTELRPRSRAAAETGTAPAPAASAAPELAPHGPALEARTTAGLDSSENRPARLGRIIIHKLLGRGAHGRVYLGHHELLDLPVAVKLLRPELTQTLGERERLLREARLAARLAHRHIVRLLEVNETYQGVYLAFEYVSGGTVNDLIERQPGRQLPLATAIRLTREAAWALAEANRLGIIHRDIKPANLLLTPEGELKVADFGLARQIAPVATDLHVTMAGSLVGTPLYMAPEQLVLGEELDIRTDLYALGSVLYEMLAGSAPFALPDLAMAETNAPATSVTARDVFYHQTHTPPRPLAQIRPDVPAWLEALCLKLLAKQPDNRLQTPEALLAALQDGA